MLNSRYWLLVLAVCVPCVLLYAGDDPEEPERRQVRVYWQGDEAHDEPTILDDPLRLEFFIDEGDGHRFDVVCAAEDYRISIDMGNQDGENHVEIDGTVQQLDVVGRLFLTFEVTIHHANLVAGDEVTFSANGSTIVTQGERSKLVTFPGPSLSVNVSPAG